METVRFLFVFLLAASSVVSGTAQPAALPSAKSVLTAAREALRRDPAYQHYRYQQRLIRRDLDGDGAVKETSVRVYDVLPDAWGTPGWRILVEEDGTPRPDEALAADRARLARERAEAAEAYARETPAERSRREARQRRELREEATAIDEAFTVVEARVTGREFVDGEPTIVVAFEPREGASATTDIGRVLSRSAGRVWFSERDHQLVRFDGTAIDTVLYGWGLIARVHQGTRLVLERTRVDSVWLPKQYRLTGSARFVLLRSVRFDTESSFFGYQRSAPTAAAATNTFRSARQ